jgi:hypothetical protein
MEFTFPAIADDGCACKVEMKMIQYLKIHAVKAMFDGKRPESYFAYLSPRLTKFAKKEATTWVLPGPYGMGYPRG